jgi:hypothetical protein
MQRLRNLACDSVVSEPFRPVDGEVERAVHCHKSLAGRFTERLFAV